MPPRPDVSRNSVRVQIAGHVFDLHQAEVSRVVGRQEPAQVRDHFVEIRGRRYPVKQALGVATGLDLSDFTSQHARSALRRLGFPVGRLSSRVGAQSTATDVASAPEHSDEPQHFSAAADKVSLAATLRGHYNRWVAVQRNQVLTDQDSFSDVVAWLRSNGVKADAVFLVPDDPECLLAGLTS